MISAVEFWNWFARNNSKFFFLNQVNDESEREGILDEFLDKLHEYSPGLYFQIGGQPDEIQDLIISAEGNIDYFDKVEELAAHAPRLENWNIVAFKPPVGNFVISQNGVSIDPRETWFLPLENKRQPSLFGVRLFITGFSELKKDSFLNAAHLVLDSLLGEKINTLKVHHLEVAPRPIDPYENKLFPLSELPSYISKRKPK